MKKKIAVLVASFCLTACPFVTTNNCTPNSMLSTAIDTAPQSGNPDFSFSVGMRAYAGGMQFTLIMNGKILIDQSVSVCGNGTSK